MTKKCGVILGAMMACTMYSAVNAFAQSKNNAPSHPFDIVLEIVSDAGLSGQFSNDSCIGASTTALGCRQLLGTDADVFATVEAGLVENFGPVNSRRGQQFIWHIDNPTKTASQKDTVTVVLTSDRTGESFLVVDRVRPGTIFARDKRNENAKTKSEKRERKKQKPVDPVLERAKQF